MSEHPVGVPVVLEAPILAETHLNLSPKQTPQALKEMNKITSHFPLSLIASSNLPSAMAVVTSLVWEGGQRRRVAGSKP